MAGSFEKLNVLNLLFQDANDVLLKVNSAADRGTFTQIRNLFGHKGMKRDVMASYQHNTDFYEVRAMQSALLAEMMD